MISLEQIRSISKATPSKIIFLVLDGLGGLPHPDPGVTELETAVTPNLDMLARDGVCGLSVIVSAGITPGSAPGHLAIFGYDPLIPQHQIGRGVLGALGIGLELRDGDAAARGNFCTVDDGGLVTDRRAGRISSEKCAELCDMLTGMSVDDVDISVHPEKEHRFVAIFRGKGLSSALSDSDPQRVGLAPLDIQALSPGADTAASVANKFIAAARERLDGLQPANMVLLRGFAKYPPEVPRMDEVFKLNPAAVASYPMYRGLARVVGMHVLDTGTTIEEEITTVVENYDVYDFFFIHVKGTDSAGEDGDFDRKVKVIEEVDAALPLLTELEPDVIVVTGDHSTPALLKGHSWHPVPFLLYSKYCRRDGVEEFSERACAGGALGNFPAVDIMPLALANALKLDKYGA
ncbi:MAG: 2,3-bisphosphoglycerate-independent phosphoglycerate mutase [Chloroflexota bacterium]|nr:2,3-bisphosphoglycerate-independent phosphoglycerate mutase [Chloroflexota bacterium]